ncbi:alpha-galactosidase [Candidatus Poribacteria bacterium]|nr:alpha-galactosidase [Candidatus Poribacteria bacterium]
MMQTNGVLGAALLLAGTALVSDKEVEKRVKLDWLVAPVDKSVKLKQCPTKNEIILTNGLISRTFRLSPNFATIDYTNLMTGASVIRGVKPEAIIKLDGHLIEIGGLKGQPDYAYLDPSWLEQMTSNPDAFQLTGYSTSEPKARYHWEHKRHAANVPWPPRGLELTANFQPPENLGEKYKGLTVSVHYEMYEGIPLLCKWVTITNGSGAEIIVEAVESEILAVTEQEQHRLHIESDYAFYSMNTTHWGPDSEYKTQIDYHYQMPVLLVSKYPLGPGAHLKPGEQFESFGTFELLYDSDDRERQGLVRRRMYRILAPQVTENPIFMHVRSSEPSAVRLAIDQCAEVGFEMIILTFGSGFNIESENPDYIANFKAIVDYAHSKGIEVGGYTLMCASRNVGDEHNCISPETGKPGSKFGQSACLASEWADGYFRRVLNFMRATGMDMIETDGPYHGDVCASITHKHHRSLEDSQWKQWQACVKFYHECRNRGIYINSPDWYYLNGSNKCGMGYRETNFSLPRWRQILISRQNIYDGTFEKTPSMGWMFVPLVEYHGGGAAATFEPLSEHLQEYEWHLAQNFGSGVIACYRGPRLYDTEETKAVVKKWVDFYKKYRIILDSDIIHIRRPDGKDIDCIMHVNSQTKERALAMVYNPTDREITTTLKLPLYYAGLTDKAMIREQEGEAREYKLDREYNVYVPVNMRAKTITWFVVE